MEAPKMAARFSMKVFVTVIAALLVVSTAGSAQIPRHELALSVGIVTFDQIFDFAENLTITVGTLGLYQKENLEYSSVPFLTYRYTPKGRFGFGAAVGRFTTKGNLTSAWGSTNGTFRETNVICAAEIAYRWIMRRGFQLYSGLGAGVNFERCTNSFEGSPDDITSRLLPTFHLNAVGFRLGESLALFLELGAGYKGIVNIGLSGRF